tara:strand:- start:817 stop:1470 length:654 start_codon:yes stop_codon:yes gene_type:complete
VLRWWHVEKPHGSDTVKAENLVKGSYRNIVDAYNSASPTSHAEGSNWYMDAHRIAWQLSGMLGSNDIRVGAGIIAALSPQMEWGDNVTEAIQLCSTGKSPRQTKANEDKAILIGSNQDPEEILGGAKVTAFYHAMVSPTGQDKPVIDRHAIAVYYGKPVSKTELSRVFGSKKAMQRIQSAYIRAGKVTGQHYNVVQATTWVQHRKNKGIVKKTAWGE